MGLLILGNSTLITTTITVTVAAISLTQQVQMPNMLKNHILGVWNSSDISLDLGKLHNQDTDHGTLPIRFYRCRRSQ